jgi:alkanesulfonate monooxygenase SsuD/methylene tetrahydromethanopterin reductase-like flavin-dependent oxidoreductase (luciferase family)
MPATGEPAPANLGGTIMEFGIFDHLDRRDEPLASFYDDRLAMVSAAEEAGFYAYHIAEHHATPLGMAPSPNLFMTAMARATSRIRIGPLVYLLPLYHPVRLIEEICMLDHLSNGRLDVGIGRGVSPYEVACFGVDPDLSRDIFEETMEVLLKGLTSDSLSHAGKYHQINDVPMELWPLQKPYPPLWYGAANESGTEFSARNGMNMVTLGATDRVKGLVAQFNQIWEETKSDARRKDSPVKDPLIGVGRHVFIADTDEEAERLAGPAYKYWYDSLVKLWLVHDAKPVTGMIIDSYEEARRIGVAVVGSPATVLADFQAQMVEIDMNYLVCQFSWGCLTHAQEMRSLELFTSEVMPALA